VQQAPPAPKQANRAGAEDKPSLDPEATLGMIECPKKADQRGVCQSADQSQFVLGKQVRNLGPHLREVKFTLRQPWE
jgi:hypothetical protein